ncbi:hypothetical protein FNO01nite_10830 [Flavobacterium noncentrifugens]|uniref:Dolichyl-phosphate-mannose-protein mannosyltransferase n=1 Tax=Flavobacterium noncentrifugens TaxID=1128970 RepID=A0A1G8VA29_9FLAO|nr:hypothetical protein [Flavobacterium noncentrifugens]GEP50411.1 hypothetical protein FNO01nite_10830 [Flavobacterium noncentrifugens]SDJ62952.1 hypothetical protein SAMN04487935_1255 [Flavobacterium noncentrifugens]
MNNLLNRFPKQLSILFACLSVVYFVISLTYFIQRPASGDEPIFVNDLNMVINQGWIAAIANQISIPYTMLAYPFALFMETFRALQAANILVLIALFAYFLKIVKVENKAFYFYLVFYLATIRLFFSGINDPLFILGLVVFFIEIFYFLEKGKMNSETLAFSGLVIAFFTRALTIVYTPAILLSFFFLYRNGFRFSKNIRIPIVLAILFIGINMPSILKNHKLSYDNKKPPEGVAVNWTQRQYLAQMWVNEGKIKNMSHPSWEQTEAYVKEHGPGSLPDNMIAAVFHDPKMTMKEIVKDFSSSLFFGFRQLGLMILFPFYFIGIALFVRRKFSNSWYIPLVFVGMTFTFSVIIISFLELRWLCSAYIPVIFFFSYYSVKDKHANLILWCNYLVLCGLSLYGMYKVFLRF